MPSRDRKSIEMVVRAAQNLAMSPASSIVYCKVRGLLWHAEPMPSEKEASWSGGYIACVHVG